MPSNYFNPIGEMQVPANSTTNSGHIKTMLLPELKFLVFKSIRKFTVSDETFGPVARGSLKRH